MVGMSYRDPVTKALIKIPTGCAGGGAPVGFVGPYAGSVAPTGWVICDGRAHNSPALQSLLGSANTPDLRGRFILAASSTHAAKTTGGEENHTLTVAEIPAHSHSGGTDSQSANHTHSGTTDNAGNHAHTSAWQGYVSGGSGGGGSVPIDNVGGYSGYTTGVAGDHGHGFTTGGESAVHAHGITSEGGGGAHNNMPPFYAMVYIIKAFAESANGGITQADADARYVNITGDTMTGDLNIPGARLSSAGVTLRKGDPLGTEFDGSIYTQADNNRVAIRDFDTGGLANLQINNGSDAYDAATYGQLINAVSGGMKVRAGIATLVFSGGGAPMHEWFASQGIVSSVFGIALMTWGGQTPHVFNVEVGAPGTFRVFGTDTAGAALSGNVTVAILAVGI